jgi:hypothetical protein
VEAKSTVGTMVGGKMTLVILAYCPCCSLPKQSCGRFEHCLAEIGPVLMCENMVRESWPPNDNRRRAQREEHPVKAEHTAEGATSGRGPTRRAEDGQELDGQPHQRDDIPGGPGRAWHLRVGHHSNEKAGVA